MSLARLSVSILLCAPIASASPVSLRGGPRVVDADGRVLGTAVDILDTLPDKIRVLRRVAPDTIVSFAVLAGGPLPNENFQTSFVHLPADCGGERYLFAPDPGTNFIVTLFPLTLDGTVPMVGYYPVAPYVIRTFGSRETLPPCDSGEPMLPSGMCCQTLPVQETGYSGLSGQVDFSEFTLPFRLR